MAQHRTKRLLAAALTSTAIVGGGVLAAVPAHASTTGFYDRACAQSWGGLRIWEGPGYGGNCDDFFATLHDITGATYLDGHSVSYTHGNSENDNWRQADLYSGTWGSGSVQHVYSGTSTSINLGTVASIGWSPDW